MSDRDALLEQIKSKAVVHGKVTLSSGKEADYYIDLRRVTLHHEASALVGQVMLELLDNAGITFQSAGGLTMGADPVGTALMHAAAREERAIDAFEGTVLAVTHVTPIKLLVRMALGAPLDSVYRMELAPASVTVISWFSDGTASMRMFNGRPMESAFLGR